MFGNLLTNSELATVRARLATIEQKLDAVMRHLGVDWESELSHIDRELVALLREGKKLEAVKIYKAKTGCTLLDAKRHVESLV